MTGADLKCARCGAGAKDVALDYPLEPAQYQEGDPLPLGVSRMDTCWTCLNGHRQFHTWVRKDTP